MAMVVRGQRPGWRAAAMATLGTALYRYGGRLGERALEQLEEHVLDMVERGVANGRALEQANGS